MSLEELEKRKVELENNHNEVQGQINKLSTLMIENQGRYKEVLLNIDKLKKIKEGDDTNGGE